MKLLDTPCKCGWRYVGTHLCIDRSLPEAVTPKVKRAYKPRPQVGHRRGSPEWKAAISVATKAARDARWVYDEERNSRIIEAYKNGATMREISETSEIGYRIVASTLAQAQEKGLVVIRPRAVRPKKIPTDAVIAEAYNSGLNIDETFKKLGTTKTAVRQALARCEAEGTVVMRLGGNHERSKRMQAVAPAVVQGYKDGLTLRQLKDKYDMAQTSVLKIVHDARDRGEVVMRKAARPRTRD